MKSFMFAVAIALLLVGMSATSFAQPATNQADVKYIANVVATPLAISFGGDVTYDALRPGMAYKTIADAAAANTNIMPFNGGEAFTPAELDIAGDGNAQVVLTFVLPSRLYAVGTGLGYVDMSYDNQSGNWFDASSGVSHFFNPENGATITLDAGGVGLLFLGGNPTVSANATQDEYDGYGLVVADYAGVTL